MTKYRKKQVDIEALKFDGSLTSAVGISAWVRSCGGKAAPLAPEKGNRYGISVSTPNGVMTASPGDFVVRFDDGEFYPWKPAIFALTYDEVEE